jgi:hypothetical protein
MIDEITLLEKIKKMISETDTTLSYDTENDIDRGIKPGIATGRLQIIKELIELV